MSHRLYLEVARGSIDGTGQQRAAAGETAKNYAPWTREHVRVEPRRDSICVAIERKRAAHTRIGTVAEESAISQPDRRFNGAWRSLTVDSTARGPFEPRDLDSFSLKFEISHRIYSS